MKKKLLSVMIISAVTCFVLSGCSNTEAITPGASTAAEQENTEEAPKENTEEAPKENTEEAPKENTEEAPKENTEGQPDKGIVSDLLKEDKDNEKDQKDDGDEDYEEEDGGDGIVDSSKWLGNYVSEDRQSLAIFPDMGNRLDITAITYSEDGFREWNTTAVVSESDPTKAEMSIGEGDNVLLVLDDNGIRLDTSPVGGLFMDGYYSRQEEPTNASIYAKENGGNNSGYSVATSMSTEDVEKFAKNVRIWILENDYDSIIEHADYPFYIDGTEYKDEDALFKVFESGDSILNDEDFLKTVRDADGTKLFAVHDGIGLGTNENVWLVPTGEDTDYPSLLIASFTK